MKKKFLLFFILYPFCSFSHWMMISGKYSGDWRVEVATEIRGQAKNLIFILDFFEPVDFSNIYNSQQINLLSQYFKGSKNHETIVSLKESLLKRLLVYLKGDSFFINRSFRVKTLLDLDEFYLLPNFPTQTDSSISSLYLNTNSFPLDFKKQVLDLVEEKKSLPDVVFCIASWINQNFFISLTKSPPLKNIELKNIDLINITQEGFLDLWVYALRTAGIPARIVHGYSLPATFWVEKDEEKVQYFYPRGDYHWIEIFVGRTGWLPIDPFAGTFFFIPQTLIRKTDAPFFQKYQDHIFVYPKKPKNFSFASNIFSEKEMEEKKLKVETKVDCEDYLLTPPIQIQETIKKPAHNLLSFLPQQLGLSDNFLKLDIEVTPNEPLSQKIMLSEPKKSSSIVLPLYLLELSKKGQIWLEVLSENKVYKSEIIEPILENPDLNYRLFNFQFSEEMLLNQEITLTLKVKNLSAVFWYGIIGNLVGTKQDTFRKQGIYLHADMCYQIR